MEIIDGEETGNTIENCCVPDEVTLLFETDATGSFEPVEGSYTLTKVENSCVYKSDCFPYSHPSNAGEYARWTLNDPCQGFARAVAFDDVTFPVPKTALQACQEEISGASINIVGTGSPWPTIIAAGEWVNRTCGLLEFESIYLGKYYRWTVTW